MTAPEMRERLKDRNLVYLSGVLNLSYGRLRRWYLGNENALNIEELRKLIEYLRK